MEFDLVLFLLICTQTAEKLKEYKDLAQIYPLKRGGQPEEVAQAIVWLLSDKASMLR